jgi:NAD+ kinase
VSQSRGQIRRAPRVLVIYKKSAYQIYVRERRHTRIQQLLAAREPAALRLVRAHENHVQSLEHAREVLARLGADAKFRHRSDYTHAKEVDLVVTLGGDGTLLWAAHLVSSDTPIVAINTAPRDSVGYFCAGTRNQLRAVLAAALKGELPVTAFARMRVTLDGRILSNRVLNDALFCHECPASTARYRLRIGRSAEEQKSSGLWVGPAAGSSAAQRSAGGDVLPAESQELQFVVREPYNPLEGGYQLRKGRVTPRQVLRLDSHMRAGRLYLDGPHDVHHVEMASSIEFQRSPEPLMLLGFRGRS